MRKKTKIFDFNYPYSGRYDAAETAYHLRRKYPTLPEGWVFNLYPATGIVYWELVTSSGQIVREGVYDLYTAKVKHWVVNSYK